MFTTQSLIRKEGFIRGGPSPRSVYFRGAFIGCKAFIREWASKRKFADYAFHKRKKQAKRNNAQMKIC